MATRNMLVVADKSGNIIAAKVEDLTNAEVQGFISPSSPEHILYRMTDVPEEIGDLRDPHEFSVAITRHFNSDHAKVRPTNAEEYFNFVNAALCEPGHRPTYKK